MLPTHSREQCFVDTGSGDSQFRFEPFVAALERRLPLRHARPIGGPAAIIHFMKVAVTEVHPGTPTMVDAVLAGVRVRAGWMGAQPAVGDHVDVDLEIDEVLVWKQSISAGSDESMLREGPLLHGVVENQEGRLLTIRVHDAVVMVEVDDCSVEAPSGTAVSLVAEHLTLYPTGI